MTILRPIFGRGVAQRRLGAKVPEVHQKFPLLLGAPAVPKAQNWSAQKCCLGPPPPLKDILTSTKLKPTKCNAHVGKCYLCEGVDCMRKNFCYQLTCTECSQTYVGESGRFYRNRMWEHFKSVKGCNRDTAMGGHYQESHAEIETPEVPFEYKVLRSCRDYPDRLIGQSVFIKYLSPEIKPQHSIERDKNGGWVKNKWQVL